MKTILTCMVLAALAFGLLPGVKEDKGAADEKSMVLLVERSAPEQTIFPDKEEPLSAEQDAADEGQTQLRLLADGEVQTLSMQEYLTEVLLSEMPANFKDEARKAQCVAARTFTYKKLASPKHEQADLCADYACCQAWTSREQLKEKYGKQFDTVWQKAEELVCQTAGEVLSYDGALIDAVYFSCSGGQTEPAVSVWGTDVPYLQAVASPGEEDAPRFSSEAVYAAEAFSAILRTQAPEIDLSGSPVYWLGGCTLSQGGGVETYTIGGVPFSGTELRRLFGLNSTRFTVSYEGDCFIFEVLGYGHRVGLSQYGAENMAKQGFSYRTILQYYYQGTRLEEIGA